MRKQRPKGRDRTRQRVVRRRQLQLSPMPSRQECGRKESRRAQSERQKERKGKRAGVEGARELEPERADPHPDYLLFGNCLASVAQTFLSASFGLSSPWTQVALPGSRLTELESSGNPQTGMSALRDYLASSIFKPATTSTAASNRRMTRGVRRRLPSSAPINPPSKAAGAHHLISGGSDLTLCHWPSRPA